MGSNDAARTGAGAGAIAGAGVFLAQVIASVSTAAIQGPERSAEMMEPLLRSLGLPPTAPDPVTFYATAVGTACCFGLVDVALATGLGALAGMIWYQMTGRTATPPA
jgi:hypothetical protein